MGSRSRTKGHQWERDVANRLTIASGRKHERNLEEVRSGNSGDILGPLPLSVQCKVGGLPRIYDAVKEAVAASKPGEYAVAVIKKDGSRHRAVVELAVMPMEDFEEIVGILTARGIW